MTEEDQKFIDETKELCIRAKNGVYIAAIRLIDDSSGSIKRLISIIESLQQEIERLKSGGTD